MKIICCIQLKRINYKFIRQTNNFSTEFGRIILHFIDNN